MSRVDDAKPGETVRSFLLRIGGDELRYLMDEDKKREGEPSLGIWKMLEVTGILDLSLGTKMSVVAIEHLAMAAHSWFEKKRWRLDARYPVRKWVEEPACVKEAFVQAVRGMLSQLMTRPAENIGEVLQGKLTLGLDLSSGNHTVFLGGKRLGETGGVGILASELHILKVKGDDGEETGREAGK